MYDSTDEDERVLRKIEEMERRQEERMHKKGKGIMLGNLPYEVQTKDEVTE